MQKNECIIITTKFFCPLLKKYDIRIFFSKKKAFFSLFLMTVFARYVNDFDQSERSKSFKKSRYNRP